MNTLNGELRKQSVPNSSKSLILSPKITYLGKHRLNLIVHHVKFLGGRNDNRYFVQIGLTDLRLHSTGDNGGNVCKAEKKV